jgi:hypothetical protein
MSYYYPQAAVELNILPEDFQLTSAVDLNKMQRIIVQAKRVSVVRNDYRSADTFSMDLDYKNFPFDPRSIRTCGVTIYLQDMGRLYNDDGSLNTIQPGSPTPLTANAQATNANGDVVSGPPAAPIPNVIFNGFVDDESVEFNDAKREVHFEGRDCSSILIDQKYQNTIGTLISPFSNTQPIDVAIKSLLQRFPATQKINVDTSRVVGPLPILGSYDPDFGSIGTANTNMGKHDSYWDIIQSFVGKAGLVAYMDLVLNQNTNQTVPTIILATPRNRLFTDDIKFIYGKNVKNFSMKRKLGRLKGFNVRVTTRIGKSVLSATIPQDATLEWANAYQIQRTTVMAPTLDPSGALVAQQPAPTLVFPIPGDKIANKQALVQIGQTIYEQYSLQQLEGSMDTFEMQGRGSNRDALGNSIDSNVQYDLTQIQKGQTISLELYPEDLKAISRVQDVSARTQYLVQRGYSNAIANVFANCFGKFSPRFQIKSHTMSLDHEQGWKLHIEFYNVLDTTQRGFDTNNTAIGSAGIA